MELTAGAEAARIARFVRRATAGHLHGGLMAKKATTKKKTGRKCGGCK